MLDLSYPAIRDLFQEHLDPKRSESASFLIWYFENWLRLDALSAVDQVCDQHGDKGVDGIYVNEEANLIEVFQSKIAQKADSRVGDTSLKEFAGTLSQFDDVGTLTSLVESAGDAEVAQLIIRLELLKRITEFEIRGVFLSNSELDANGTAFLNTFPRIRFVGRTELQTTFVSPIRNLPISKKVEFDISGFDTARYIVDQDHVAVLAPIKASELVMLDGIANQSLFAYNVRGPLGRTQVNKDITTSIRSPERHKIFPLFHNGITIIAEDVTQSSERIGIGNYFVVNGCQSLTALYDNSKYLTDDLRVLARIVLASPSSKLAEMVTQFSNNQNGVKARDFKSNNPIQIRLQNEFAKHYEQEYFYEIKRGEASKGLKVITNEQAGLYLMAFDLKQPWGTHRKYQVFDDLHSDLFGKPSVTAHRIVLCDLLAGRVLEASTKLVNTLLAKYVLTRFLMLYFLRLVLEKDEIGMDIIKHPETYVLEVNRRNAMLAAVDGLLTEVVTDINAELEEAGEDFDYRGKLRDEKWCKELASEIVSTHEKLVARKRLESFTELYTEALTA